MRMVVAQYSVLYTSPPRMTVRTEIQVKMSEYAMTPNCNRNERGLSSRRCVCIVIFIDARLLASLVLQATSIQALAFFEW